MTNRRLGMLFTHTAKAGRKEVDDEGRQAIKRTRMQGSEVSRALIQRMHHIRLCVNDRDEGQGLGRIR